MADVLAQCLTVERGDDISIVLTGTFDEDPTSWAAQFSVAKQRGQTPVLTVTTASAAPIAIASVSGNVYTATIPISRAQSSALALDEYDWDLHRTDSGSVSIKAGGTLQIATPVYPPVSS